MINKPTVKTTCDEAYTLLRQAFYKLEDARELAFNSNDYLLRGMLGSEQQLINHVSQMLLSMSELREKRD